MSTLPVKKFEHRVVSAIFSIKRNHISELLPQLFFSLLEFLGGDDLLLEGAFLLRPIMECGSGCNCVGVVGLREDHIPKEIRFGLSISLLIEF